MNGSHAHVVTKYFAKITILFLQCESDDDLRIEEDEEFDEIMHFVFGEEIDSDCEI